MSLLVVSVLTLALGPLLYRVADSVRSALNTLDGFVLITVSGLVLVHILPHAYAVAGPLALVVAAVGFLGPALVERNLHESARTAHVATLIFACLGLIVHEFLDGVALGAAALAEHDQHQEGTLLAMAVVLHRLPVAITIWWLLRPASGVLAAALVLIAMGMATIGGYTLSGVVHSALSQEWVSAFQALVAGSLLHVVIHRPSAALAPSPTGEGEGGGRAYAGAGALAGLVVVALLADTHLPLHESGTMSFRQTFWTLALESAPALLIAFALVGLVHVFVPKAPVRWMKTGRPLTEAARGMAFGLPLPICSCGVIPLYHSLVMRGVPATAAMAFLIATPELGLDAILISLPLLGAELAVARVLAAAAVALVIGMVVGRMVDAAHPPAAPVEAPAEACGSFWTRIRTGLRHGFGEIVDDVGPWLLLGLVIASLVEPLFSGRWLTSLPWGVDVALFALLGMPMYVCASGATPLVAVLLHKGVSPGAAVAFLLAGPATNITTFGVLMRLHGRRIALVFAGAIAALAIGSGMVVNLAIRDASGLALQESADASPDLVNLLSLAALTVVLALSVLRQGPRAFIGQVIPIHDEDHDHGPDAEAHEHRCCGCGPDDGHGDHDEEHDHGPDARM